jgi:hypothetical protein
MLTWSRRDFYEQASTNVPNALPHTRTVSDLIQKKFMCESTGHTGYTFFEAKESEVRSTPVLEKGSLIVITPQAEPSKEINSILSDDLRARVLDYVQFQSTSRMDDLGKSSQTVNTPSLLTWYLVNDVFDVCIPPN